MKLIRKLYLVLSAICVFMFVALYAVADDPDFDGFSTEMELVVGTEPEDSASHPTLADNQWKLMTCWPLSNDAVESFGSGLDGSLKNGAKFWRNALMLDGVNDYMTFGDDTVFNFHDEFSISLWMKPAGKWGRGRIIGKYSNDAQRQYAVFMHGTGRLYIFLSENGSNKASHTMLEASGKKIIKRNQWQHLSVTCDLGNEGRRIRTYIDGLELPLRVVADSEMKEIFSGAADLTLGGYDVKVKNNHCATRKMKDKIQNPFRGGLRQLLLGHAELTDLEVRELHHLGMNGDVSVYINTDYDSDSMPDWWERRYFGDIQPDAIGDEDKDGQSNLREYQQYLDPTSSDTDKDGFDDSYDAQISRVTITGDIQFTDGDEYVYPGPDWLLGVHKKGGEWHSWYVDASSVEPASLSVELNRTILSNDLVMEIEYLETAGSSLYVALLNSGMDVLNNDVFADEMRDGNIQAEGVGEEMSSFQLGDERVVRKKFIVPLESYPEASILQIYRGTGEILVLEISLYEDPDGDGLDSQQETQIGTSPNASDSDGDGLLDGSEVFDYGTSPTVDDSTVDNDEDGISNLDEIHRGTGIDDPDSTSIYIYVDTNASDSQSPYNTLTTAATIIQDALDIAEAGDTVCVASGTYNTGGKIGTTDSGNQLTNRVYVPAGVTLKSLAGRDVTIIEGAADPDTEGLGPNATRGVLLEANAVLDGFTVRGGYTGLQGYGLAVSGGGVLLGGIDAVVTDCVLEDNFACCGGGAFGVLMQERVENSIVTGNDSVYLGGGIGAVPHIVNCVISGNSTLQYGGGVFESSEVLNCTICGNTAGLKAGGVYSDAVKNCIIYDNTAPVQPNYDEHCPISYSCTTPLPGGAGNIEADPKFVDAGHGNYRLSAGSPCINIGSNESWMMDATDIDGNERIADSSVDMGAYEADGIALEFDGVNLYVALGNAGSVPYGSWDDAAPDIQTALDYAEALRIPGLVVNVADGIYNTGGKIGTTDPDNQLTNRVYVSAGVTIKSLAGRDVTIIEGAPDPSTGGLGENATRGVYLEDGATLDGFTVRNGHTESGSGFGGRAMGGGVYCASSATVMACTVINNHAGVGGGVAHGQLYDSLITGNVADFGGGISDGFAYDGFAYKCEIIDNVANHGGGAFLFHQLRNCLIVSNVAETAAGLHTCTAISCTVANNTASSHYGGVFSTYIGNTIVYGNTAPEWPDAYEISFAHSCITYTPSCEYDLDLGGNIDADPQFVNPDNGDFRLSSGSPCIDKGLSKSWMDSETDIDGVPRIRGASVDIGAYEKDVGYSDRIRLCSELGPMTWNGASGSVIMSVNVPLPSDFAESWHLLYLSASPNSAAGWHTENVGISVNGGPTLPFPTDDSLHIEDSLGSVRIDIIYTNPQPGGTVAIDGAMYFLLWRPKLKFSWANEL